MMNGCGGDGPYPPPTNEDSMIVLTAYVFIAATITVVMLHKMPPGPIDWWRLSLNVTLWPVMIWRVI